MSTKGMKLEKENFTIEVKYSEEAIAKKLVKFTVTKGNEIVLTADEIISMLVNQVNSEVLSAAFVETDRVNVVEVGRQIRCLLDKDYQKGQVININYSHPYPIEFALIEEAWKIAQINKDTKVTELTVEYLDAVKKKITPSMVDYTQKFYKSFNSLNLKKNMEEENKDVVAETPVEETAAPVEETAAPVEGEEQTVAEPVVPEGEEVAPAVEPEATPEVAAE